MIRLLNCLGKVVEKMAAEAISHHRETTKSLHPDQMGSRKQRNTIDTVACSIQRTHDSWKQQQPIAVIFMDVKSAFDHVKPSQLVSRMRELGLDGDFIRWTQPFLANRKVQLVIDNTQCPIQSINSGVPQGSPVSPILFAIYLSGVFNEIERRVPGVHTLSFADDIGLLAPEYSVQETCLNVQEAAKLAIDWGRRNMVQFDAEKTEAALFTRKRGGQAARPDPKGPNNGENHPAAVNWDT